jgi:hypothetical protein
MNTASFPMPGALRWRVLHPLIDGDGSCSLIYDLERAAVLEVPPELQLHVAPALETGDLDDDLLTWLVEEDLLTTEGWAAWEREGDGGPAVPGWWARWGIQRFDDEVHARIAPACEGEVEETLGSLFKQSAGVPRVQLLLDWGGLFPGAQLVERIVVEASRRAAEEHQEVAFELVLDTRQVTPAVAAFLARSPLHLRLRCGDTLEPPELVLLADVFDRANVQCSLTGGARLLDLWAWAKRAGVRHLETIRSELFAADDALPAAARVREYRSDLLAVCDDMVAELGARRVPIDYRPLTRMIRRLMRSEPRVEPALDDLDDSPCRACWARHVCNHSELLAISVGGDERPEPSPERCAVWLAEAEVALRLYHRLAQCDPMDVLRLLGDSARMPLDPLGRRDELETPKQLF